MKFKSLIAVASAGLLLASCLKNEDKYGLQEDSGTIVSEIFSHNVADPNFVSVNPAPATETIDLLTVRFYAPRDKKPNADVKIKLRFNNTLIADFNSANGTHYLVMPANAYTLSDPGLEVTVARSGNPGEYTMKITVNKNNLSLTETYALGFTIESVSEGVISENAKNYLFVLGVKNKYDGRYRITGTFVDHANAAFTAAYPLEWELVTNGPAQSVVYDNVQLGIPGYVFLNAGAPTYYGSFGLVINFDASDNVSSLTNYYGQPSGNGRSAELDPSGVNKYNAATKVVNIKYWMNQPSVITPHRASFNETWTYLGPR